MKYEIYKTKKGEFSWRLKGANGEKLAHGEGYTTKSNCYDCVRLVQGSAIATVIDKTIPKTEKRGS